MSAGPSLDLAQTYKVATLEVAIAVLELPERRIRISCVKYIAFYPEVSICDSKQSL